MVVFRKFKIHFVKSMVDSIVSFITVNNIPVIGHILDVAKSIL